LDDMILEQIKHHGDNFSYIIGDEETGEVAVVDPSYNANAIIDLVRARGVRVRYVISTHHHGDHTAGNAKLREALGAKVVAHRLSPIEKDVGVEDDDVLDVGKLRVRVFYTPGHTHDSICLLAGGVLLTGDTLFVGECGRTDLGEGSAEQMYNSLFQRLMKLDDATLVFPGHDYGPKRSSTIGEERKTNYTLKERNLEEFIRFMAEP